MDIPLRVIFPNLVTYLVEGVHPRMMFNRPDLEWKYELGDNTIRNKRFHGNNQTLYVHTRRDGRMGIEWDKNHEFPELDRLQVEVSFNAGLPSTSIVTATLPFGQRYYETYLPSSDDLKWVSVRALHRQLVRNQPFELHFYLSKKHRHRHENTWFDMASMCSLQAKAESFLDERSNGQPVHVLVRNKPWHHFDQIYKHGDGILYPEVKGNHGDRKSPANGNICGLFFVTTYSLDGPLANNSLYGDGCLSIPAAQLVNPEMNLYFADFYCTKESADRNHRITLIVTSPGSLSDGFCRENLPQLDIYNNRFLWRDVNALFTRHE